MDKNLCALTPPMGWNSWDCYGASVTEAEIRQNAEYMAAYLKPFGWEYVVCDIQWYEPSACSTSYNKFAPLCMDGYGRLIPAENRFPSAAGGKGFQVLAKDIHDLGLKFGIHIMRGIPRQAVHENCQVKGMDITAREIAHPFSVCSWNTDMYGLDDTVPGAQAYYDSLFELYAEWGVDFIKVDDICVTHFKPHDRYFARAEIDMIRHGIDRCGRQMVLSLSPGPALIESAQHLGKTANMWRITNDLWDDWKDILAMFDRCREWAPYAGPGCWPDCDMLPLGHISIRGNEHGIGERYTRLTEDEQRTMMTLWCLVRSPLMIGGELTDNDAFTLGLLTNSEVLAVLKDASDAAEIVHSQGIIVWSASGREGHRYLALFNTQADKRAVEFSLRRLGIADQDEWFQVRDLWANEDIGTVSAVLRAEIPGHGVCFFKLR